MRAIITFLILCTLVLSAPAQPVQLDMQVFAQRRAGFMAQMQPDAIAIFPGKPVYLRNNDVEYSYRQESNFYYLSGFEEPESLLLLDPSAPKYKYVMYVAETRPPPPPAARDVGRPLCRLGRRHSHLQG